MHISKPPTIFVANPKSLKTKNPLRHFYYTLVFLFLSVAFYSYLGFVFFSHSKQATQHTIARHHELMFAGINDTALKAFVILLIIALAVNWLREIRKRLSAEKEATQTDQKYKDLIENSAFIVFTTDLEGNLNYVSQRCKELTGFTAEELIGENFFNLIEAEWRNTSKEFFDAHLQKRTYQNILELPIISKWGERNWVEQSVVVLEKEEEPIGFQLIAKNITEKKFAEKLLKEAEQKIKDKQDEYHETIQAILDNIPMIVYLKDMTGNFFMVNRIFHETFNTKDADVIGRDDVNVHKTQDGADQFLWADEQVKQTLQPVELEDILITRDGERHMLVVKFPLLDKNGTLFAIGGVGKDITENVRHREQLIKARVRAEKAEKLQEEFLANMSHEIRTPMNGIIGMANLLSTTSLTAEQADYLHIIRESSGILLSLINDILDLSKIKAGRMSIETIDFCIKETIESVLAPQKARAKEKNITVDTTISENVPCVVKGDQHKLKQILNNLVGNAVKFTEKGTVSLHLDLLKSNDGSLTFHFAVTDTGIGISEDNIGLIFDSFTQAGTDMVRRFGGTGLGLAITKRLIELQGGKISVESKLGEGTTFTFTIIYSSSDKVEITKNKCDEIPVAKDIFLTGKTILLVEDNLINQQVTSQILQKAGMIVDIANHGKEAIEKVGSGKHYDAVLMDLQMAEMDGFQATTYIRTKLQMSIPIIAMTASALRDEKKRCFEVGMDEYLTKPFSPQILFYHLHRLINNHTDVPIELEAQKPEALYSLDYLKEMDDDEYAAEVLQMFLDTTPNILEEINQDIIHENWSDVSKKSHSLKSSLGILQINEMLQSMSEIEVLSKKGEQFDRIGKALNDAEGHYNLVRPMLESELNSIKQKITITAL